ncbi:hypothetical protein [Paraburkholderia atlantica]|uniref:hypothetical protein n=1 Tax=Paraburkholderia atlantica TaxID=2654982 RepID=UPI0016083D8E|nr:hypothetical protein [Paraburkholderia atlantica]MBB5420675.1 hypothetical protein [Paraburkholderia atlantica]
MNETAARIKAAAHRMRGVIIEVDGNESLSIDARALDGIADEGLFDLEGEHAANLISEARAYVLIADDEVTFEDALASVVEGYLSGYRETTVAQAIDLAFWDAFKVEGSHMATIGAIEARSCVGEAVVTLLNDVQRICVRPTADGGGVEPDMVGVFKAGAYRQGRVWYFG